MPGTLFPFPINVVLILVCLSVNIVGNVAAVMVSAVD